MKEKIKNPKYLYIIVSICLAIPSIIYLIKNKSIMQFNEWFTFFFKVPLNSREAITNMICFRNYFDFFIFNIHYFAKKA